MYSEDGSEDMCAECLRHHSGSTILRAFIMTKGFIIVSHDRTHTVRPLTKIGVPNSSPPMHHSTFSMLRHGSRDLSLPYTRPYLETYPTHTPDLSYMA